MKFPISYGVGLNQKLQLQPSLLQQGVTYSGYPYGPNQLDDDSAW